MKHLMTIVLIGIIIGLVSCGNSNESKIANVKPESTSISGDLTDYLKVVDNEYEVVDDWGGKLSIKVKSIKPYKKKDLKNKEVMLTASMLNGEGMPVSGAGEFETEYSSEDKLVNLLKSGNGEEVIQLKAMLGKYEAAKHAEKCKKFSISSTVKEKPKSTNSSTSPSSESQVENGNSDKNYSSSNSKDSEDWDKVLDNYEEYVDEYIKFYKKAKAGDQSAMTRYPKLMKKAKSLSSKLQNAKGSLTPEQVKRMTKIQNKLMEVAQSNQ